MIGQQRIAHAALAVVLTIGTDEVGAQASLSSSKGGTALFPQKAGFLSVDVGESKFGIRGYRERVVTQRPSQLICRTRVPMIQDHIETTLELGIAATKGKRTLFAKDGFVPGAEVGFSVARFFERGLREPLPCPKEEGDMDLESKGYHALFFTVKGDWIERLTFTSGPVSEAPIQTDAFSSKTVLAVLGYNRAWNERKVTGLSLEVGREWASPGESQPQSYCRVLVSGRDSKGGLVQSQKCEERFQGVLSDFTVARMRLDHVFKIGVPTGDRPSFGVLLSGASSARTGRKPVYDLGMGPTFHPKGSPSVVTGAFLFELNDATNANGKTPEWARRLGVRLYVGVPWQR